MRAIDIITKKRDGGELSRDEIVFFVRGYVEGVVTDYQAAAWCMAVYFQGMTLAETVDLTHAIALSGQVLDPHVDNTFVVDKHSTGGVGDTTSLIIGPMVSAAGVPVAKLTGRGLAFTGGTLDKIEAIPGVHVSLTGEQFKRQVRQVGLVIAGQTCELAPADAKLYALRDATGSVPSLALMASSIMSKKIVSGADGIVLDVKAGRGTFMLTEEEAVKLAQLMVHIGRGLGRRMTAVIGGMHQPLGWAVGNALEVNEAIQVLQGSGPADLREHCITVAGEMLLMASAGDSPEAAYARAANTLKDGAAWTKFREWIAAQGGDLTAVDDPGLLPIAPVIEPLPSPQTGYVQDLDAREVGLTVVDLGGGRARKGDPIDPAVGVVLTEQGKVGRHTTAGEPLLWIHAPSVQACQSARDRLRAAYSFSEDPTPPPPLIHRIIR